ncbi:MAG: glycosyltransferase family 4 protein [bacterium]
MNILLPVFSDGRGGLEMYVIDLAQELMKRNHNPYLICPSDSYLDATRRKKEIPGESLDALAYVDLRAVCRLRKLLDEKSIDLIHMHDSQDYWYGAYLRMLGFSGPLVATQHMRPGHKDDWLHRIIYNRFDRFVAITNDVKTLLVERCDRPSDQVDVLHYGIRQKETDPVGDTKLSLAEELGVPGTATLLGVVGRIDPQKRQELLLKAASRLRGNGYPIEVLLVGAAVESVGRKYRQTLEELTEDLGLTDHVHFLGHREDVTRIMKELDVLCLTTDCETFGKVLVEAQAVGTPVVATDAGGAPEALRAGETGLLFEPENWRDLTDKLETLLSDDNRRNVMGKRGRSFVRENFDWEDHFDHVVSLYDELSEETSLQDRG